MSDDAEVVLRALQFSEPINDGRNEYPSGVGSSSAPPECGPRKNDESHEEQAPSGESRVSSGKRDQSG